MSAPHLRLLTPPAPRRHLISIWNSKQARDEDPPDDQALLTAPELFNRLRQGIDKPKSDLPVFNLSMARGGSTAVAVSGAIGDFDCFPVGTMQAVHTRLVQQGWAHLLYTSSRHGIGPGDEVEPDERERGLKKIAQRTRDGLGAFLGPERFRLVQPTLNRPGFSGDSVT